MQALLGKKLGMTSFIRPDGSLVGATVLEAGPCVVTDLKSVQRDGYAAIQLGFGAAKESRVSKALKGHFAKAKTAPKKILREVRIADGESYTVGQEIKADLFKPGDAVDVQGTSIGKGFAGGMKKWHWRGGPKSHGSMFHRRIGSAGASSFPSRTWPGHHMPGRMGGETKTVQNLEVLKVDPARNLILVKGAVPGSDNGFLFIRRALKLPMGIKVKQGVQDTKKKDPLKASKQAAAGKGGKK